MYVPYSELPHTSRVWIYQSDRALKAEEKADLESQLMKFCQNWSAHGKPLACSYQIYDYFLCLFVDEFQQTASGCSIDDSVAIIKSISNQYNIDFFNRLNIVYKEGSKSKLLALVDFKKILKPDIIVYNNLVHTKSDFETQWQVPLHKSWLSKFLK